jgi:hypothetical protein
MPEQQVPWELSKGDVAWGAVGGAFVGAVLTGMWISPSYNDQQSADNVIHNAVQKQTELQDTQHDIQVAGLEQTPAGQLVNQHLAEKTGQIETFVAERPVVHTGHDFLLGVGSCALIGAALNIRIQRRLQKQRAAKQLSTV